MNREYFEVGKSFLGYTWLCTCGLSGGTYYPTRQGAIDDGGGHMCCTGWPANRRPSLYIGD